MIDNKALKIAYKAHHNQFDHSGVPYIFHPYFVAELVSNVMPEEVPVCMALLHDVVEDTDVTLEQLEQEFPKEITEIVAILTHNPEEDYFEYIKRVAKNPIATQVKATDIYHNMNESRLNGVTSVSEEQKVQWEEKYKKALGLLITPEKEETKQTSKPLENKVTYDRMEKLRKKVLPYGRSVMKEHRFEVFAAIERVIQLADKERDVGMCGLEAERKELMESEIELEQFLALGLNLDAILENRSIYNMLDSFEESEGNVAQDFIRYIYMRGVMLMLAGENAQEVKGVCLSLIPDKERALFEKCWKRKKEIANRPFERTVEEMMQEKLVLIPREYWEEFC